MKHIGNDLAHIAFAGLILSLTFAGYWGFVLAGLLIGLLAEAKEENSNILKVRFKDMCLRDTMGYAIGGVIIGLIKEVLK